MTTFPWFCTGLQEWEELVTPLTQQNNQPGIMQQVFKVMLVGGGEQFCGYHRAPQVLKSTGALA